MASGFGINGGPSRCYNFWQEVLGCYVVNSGEGASGQMKCKPALEDYYECLHHRKEALRTMKMQAAYRKAEASTDREKAPPPEALRSLGLLQQQQPSSKAEWADLPQDRKDVLLAKIPENRQESFLAYVGAEQPKA